MTRVGSESVPPTPREPKNLSESFVQKTVRKRPVKRRDGAANDMCREGGRRGARTAAGKHVAVFQRALEMDVSMARNRAAAVCHGSAPARAASGTGLIRDFSLEEAMPPDAG